MPKRLPLAGVRILDLSTLLPGPLATQHLADQGAEVIKIEAPGGGDSARALGATDAAGESFFFRNVSRNKKSIVLDLKQAKGRAVFLRLVESADVVVEGFRPGVMARLGLDYAQLSEHNPQLVLCSISGYGQEGPYAQYAGHDINYLGYTGVLDQTGTVGGAPALCNLQIADLLGGTLSAVNAILLGLLDARSSGRGRHVDVAMCDTVLQHMVFPLAQLQAGGTVAPRGADLLTGGVPCYGVYRTADDRYMAVGALEAKFWQRLCLALHREDLLPAHLDRGETGQAAREALAEIFAQQPQAHWVATLTPLDCCVTPVLRLDESFADPHFIARGIVQGSGAERRYAPYLRPADCRATEPGQTPAYGGDTQPILEEIGLEPSYIETLRNEGVIV